MPVTMREVAAHAGVSIKTVSRVVNRQDELKETTRQRVLASIDSLGYVPSRIAQALTTQRTYTVGLIIPDITNPFFPEVARGVQDIAEVGRYNVIMCNTDDQPEKARRLLDSLKAQSVDGTIVFSSLVSNDKLCAFADSAQPMVAINRTIQHDNIGLVMVDNYGGAQMAVEHLVAQGHTKIGMLRGIHPPPDEHRRVQGYRDSLAAHGLPVREEWIVTGPPTIESGWVNALALLQAHPEITALFTYNDLLAIGAIRACQELGIGIPEDCAIVGFDDIHLATFIQPALTSVRVNKYALGQQAMTLLQKMITNSAEQNSVGSVKTSNEGMRNTPHHIKVRPELVVRGST